MATSNFKSLGSLPLYVFHTEGEVYEIAEEEVKKLNIRDFDTYEDFEDAREEEIEKVRDNLDSTGVVLTDFDIGELEMEVEELNDDIKSLIENDYSYDYTDEEVNLEDIATFDISHGYYEGGQITNKHPEVFDDLNEEHQEFILDHLKAIAEKFDLTELHTDARFDNGETMYSVKKEEKESKKEGEKMNEALSDNEMKESYINALSKKLSIPSESMKANVERDNIGDRYCTVEVEDDGSEYIVADYGVAKELAKERVKSTFEEDGLSAFTSNFADYVCKNFGDKEFIDDTVEECLNDDIEDLHDEDAFDSKFETRFEEECYEYNVLGDEDFEENEDGVLVLKDKSVTNIEELEYQLKSAIFANIGDHYDYLYDRFGEDEVREMLENNNAFDEEAIAEEVINSDGIGIQLASYDFEELDLGDGLFAYRID